MNNEKLVSPYIPAQFPFHYRENYPQLVEFVKMYYTWLEQSDQAIGHARRLLEYRDIDETPEEYIQYYKNKFLPYLKFNTNINKRDLVKHVQDLYKSKGTERGVDLFFKLVYGVPAEVYYPSVDLFRLSDNTWVKRKYLEIGHIELIRDYVGKKITGNRSGATAFAERFVQKKVGNTYVNLLFISDITGNFLYREKLSYEGITASNKKRPRIIGSLTNLEVTAGSSGFSVGDLVDITSETGYGARARVASVFDTTGVVDFELVDGGWGYTTNAEVRVSQKLMTLQNVIPDYTVNNPDKPPYVSSPFFTLEKVYQPLANLDYSFDTSLQNIIVSKPGSDWFDTGATLYQTNGVSNVAVGIIVSNSTLNATAQNLVVSVDKSQVDIFDFYATAGSYGNVYLSSNSSVNSSVLAVNVSTNTSTINVGSVLTSYNSTGGVISTVEVISTELDVAKTGNLFVYVLSGNAEANAYFWGAANDYSINVATYVDRTASGNVVGVSNTLTLFISNSTSIFTSGQFLTQRRTYTGGYDISATGRINGIIYAGNTATVTLSDSTGVFRPNINVYMQFANGAESGKIAYLNSYDATIGVDTLINDFVSTGNNRVYTRGYTYDGNGAMIIYGSNSVANLVYIATGKNATFEISNTLGYAESASLFTDFLGANNEANVPYMSLGLSDVQWYFPKDPTGNISYVLDDVLDSINGYIGSITKLEAVNPGEDYNQPPIVLIRDPRVAGFNKRDFTLTYANNFGSFAIGEQVSQNNGAIGLVKDIVLTPTSQKLLVRRQTLTVDFELYEVITGESTGSNATIVGITDDDTSRPTGLNAEVTANVVTADGTVATFEILASGFGFQQDQGVTFVSLDGERAGSAKAKLVNQGVTDGVFMDEASFVSSSKYLFDGDYYQEYSYDIQTSIAKEVFEDNYDSTMHLAGTKMFSTFVHVSQSDLTLDIELPESTANLIANTA